MTEKKTGSRGGTARDTGGNAVQRTGKAGKGHSTYLESLISKTTKFKVEDVLDVYRCYDEVVLRAFQHFLYPHTRFGRAWLADQARDVLAGSDKNRLIVKAQERKLREADGLQEATSVKARYTNFVKDVVMDAHRADRGHVYASEECVNTVARVVLDDACYYADALLYSYPLLLADMQASLLEGDVEDARELDAVLRTLEAEVGVRREDAHYVAVNLRASYRLVNEIVQRVTLSFSRLLYRFAHSLRGVTSTEENFSAGYEGMVRAARIYDPRGGAAFVAHSQPWVKSAVLGRQRESSVIRVPATIWPLLQRANRGELTDEKSAQVREAYELFFASSDNANKATMVDAGEEDEGYTYDTVHVTASDAEVFGDVFARAQDVPQALEENDSASYLRDAIVDGFSMVFRADPTLMQSLLIWGLREGIDRTLLVEATAPWFVGNHELTEEKEKQKNHARRDEVAHMSG